jgi:hypothetical protein
MYTINKDQPIMRDQHSSEGLLDMIKDLGETKDKTMIELLHFESHPSKNVWNGSTYSAGLTHLALNVSDINILIDVVYTQDDDTTYTEVIEIPQEA